MNRCRQQANPSCPPARIWVVPASLAELRHDFPKRAKSRSAEQVERLQPDIQPDIVAAILDDAAGVGDGGAVAVECQADRCKAELEPGMGQIHCDLPCEGSAWRAPRGCEQLRHVQS